MIRSTTRKRPALALTALCWTIAVCGPLRGAWSDDPAAPAAVSPAEVSSPVPGVNQLGFDLLALLPDDQNTVLSPASISSAMAMLYSGARGETARQMAEALRFDAPPEEVHEGVAIFRRYHEENRPQLPTPSEQLGIGVRDFHGYGVFIDRIAAGSLAARAGLNPRDLLLEVDGNPVRSPQEYADAADRAGDPVELQWYDFARGRVEKQSLTVDTEHPTTLQIVNGAWLQEGYEADPAYVKLIQEAYGAQFAELDFESGGDAPRQTINAWIARRTDDQIPSLLDAGAVTPDTRLVVTNAVRFRGQWTSPFDVSTTLTWHRPAGTAEDGEIPVRGMSQRGQFRYARTQDAEILELPYRRSSLALVLVLPNSGVRWEDFRKRFTAPALAKALQALQQRDVQVTMPKFRIDTKASLEEILEETMLLPFSDDADFRGITARDDLKLSTVRHQAYLEVDEEGTEAGAATAASAIAKSLPAVQFLADRPFLFVLADRDCGAILFIGQLIQPQVLEVDNGNVVD